MRNQHLVIELDRKGEPFVRFHDKKGDRPVPVRLRGDQENLTPAWRGHQVTAFEWHRIERFTETPACTGSDWALLAYHEEATCARCALCLEAEQRHTLLGEQLPRGWENVADRVQEVYRDYIVRWSFEPEPLDPKLDQPLQRERARVCINVSRLHKWLDVALHFVRMRMHEVWKEEDDLFLLRSSLQYLHLFGVFRARESKVGPTFNHGGTRWHVAPNGDTKRLTETVNLKGLAIQSWVEDPAGRKLSGWGDARDRARTMVSERSQTPGQRRANPWEFDMVGRDRRIKERTKEYRDEAIRLRAQLVDVTREIRGT
ncbi:hypothetical protein [Modicisalibacter sp. MOD 31.J]|uniref:hypothetical protein n=1 Tax=Modicisalibacter sp. MOD 31.J TaxID=2831897 RepID=UPI001CCC7D29|nr:hypothetical protein [Modicisalibacter sp. MOD 31.J]MBZ9574474.1 hypothetical protein [Modicisalibacter sp. MOD 31.J]